MSSTIDVPPAEASGEDKRKETLETVVVRFCGDSGDGMQLVGTQMTNVSAAFGRRSARAQPTARRVSRHLRQLPRQRRLVTRSVHAYLAVERRTRDARMRGMPRRGASCLCGHPHALCRAVIKMTTTTVLSPATQTSPPLARTATPRSPGLLPPAATIRRTSSRSKRTALQVP